MRDSLRYTAFSKPSFMPPASAVKVRWMVSSRRAGRSCMPTSDALMMAPALIIGLCGFRSAFSDTSLKERPLASMPT